MQHLSIPLRPKQSHGALKVLVIGRISTEHQNLENIDASYRYVEDYLRRVYDGPLEIKYLGERASGLLVDRATIREAEDLVATADWDLVIAEDLSRIFRNPRHQYNFVQDAVDAETRVICIGDNLDTADENWEIMMGAATLRHGTAIPDVRRRVRRTATHAFHAGGMVLKVKYGYRKLTPAEAASEEYGPKGLKLAKRPECTPVIREMMTRVLRGDHFAAVADWLLEEQVECPPYAKHWKARLVKSLLADPILAGTRTFRRITCRPIYRTGKHKREQNPQPEQKHFPELAHLTPEEHEELLRVMKDREQKNRHSYGRSHPLFNRPRSRALWPAQHLRCAICGGLMYAFGTVLKCQNSRLRADTACWNHVQVPVELARQRIISWLMATLGRIPGFEDTVLDAALSELNAIRGKERDPRGTLRKEIHQLQAQAANLTEAITRGGRLDPLIERLTAVSLALRGAQLRLSQVDEAKPVTVILRNELARRLETVVQTVARTSFEFASLIRSVLDVHIQPVQSLDTPLVRPRAKLKLTLFEATELATEPAHLENRVGIDLFDSPLHVRFAEQCLQVKRDHPHLSLKRIGARLGINYMIVKRALHYGRLVEAHGTSIAYQELHSRPQRASRWRS